MDSIQRIGVFTSGGDAPGMNAAIRAVVRACIYYEKEVVGIYNGFEGLITGDFKNLGARSVANIIQLGGTILKSARSEKFKTSEGQQQAYDNIFQDGIDALVAIGGDGTFRGAAEFNKKFKIPIIGIPCTIDNDLYGTDSTIGFDTATNTAVNAIDMIRDTALSHNRLFFIEVMGRDAGFIAIRSGIAGGAAATIIPEEKMSTQQLIQKLRQGAANKKTSSLVVVAEGGKSGSAMEIAEQINKDFPDYETKVTILGHIQRGGRPSSYDRVLASRMGVGAVEGLLNGEKGTMVGIVNNEVVYTPLKDAITIEKKIDTEALRINKILSI